MQGWEDEKVTNLVTRLVSSSGFELDSILQVALLFALQHLDGFVDHIIAWFDSNDPFCMIFPEERR